MLAGRACSGANDLDDLRICGGAVFFTCRCACPFVLLCTSTRTDNCTEYILDTLFNLLNMHGRHLCQVAVGLWCTYAMHGAVRWGDDSPRTLLVSSRLVSGVNVCMNAYSSTQYMHMYMLYM